MKKTEGNGTSTNTWLSSSCCMLDYFLNEETKADQPVLAGVLTLHFLG